MKTRRRPKIDTAGVIRKKAIFKETIIRILGRIIFFLIAVFVILNLILLVQKIQNKPASIFGYKVFVVISGSMEPNIHVGDIVITKNVDASDIKVGDVITFNNDKYTITHRVIDIIQNEEIYYKTKGDHNSVADKDLIKYNNIEGVCKFRLEKIGVIFMHSKAIIRAIIIVCILYLIFKIIDRKKEMRLEKINEKDIK